MDHLHVDNLPSFLDPLLDFLAEKLPSPIYDALFQFCSYFVIFLSGLLKLVSALPSYKPWEWDAQTILPPLIVVLSAYWMLSSVYRTTTFFIRMAFSLLKWGTILSVLGASFTWLANGGAGNEVADALNQLLGANNQRGRGPSANTRSRTRSPRPKPWDSFATHQQWQYSEEDARRTEQAAEGGSDVERVVKYIAGLAGRAVTGSAGEIFRSFMDSASGTEGRGGEGTSAGAGSTGPKTRRKAKTTSERKTSSR